VSATRAKEEEQEEVDVCRAVTATDYLQILGIREMLRCCYVDVMFCEKVEYTGGCALCCAVRCNAVLCCIVLCSTAVLCHRYTYSGSHGLV
jgi:hypothetical protein